MSDYFTGPLPSSGPPPGPHATPNVWPTATAQYATAPPAGWPPYQGRSMSGGVLALVIVGCTLGAIIIVGILAAIAIPVFLDQRAKSEAAATTVSIPEQLAGLTRMHDARSQQLEAQLRNQPGNPEVGVFGVDGSLRAAVAATRRRMTSQDDRDFLAGAEGSFARQGLGNVAFADVAAGRLGGTVRCATAARFSVCLFADHGAYGSVTLFGDMVGRTDEAVAVREAVEHRS